MRRACPGPDPGSVLRIAGAVQVPLAGEVPRQRAQQRLDRLVAGEGQASPVEPTAGEARPVGGMGQQAPLRQGGVERPQRRGDVGEGGDVPAHGGPAEA